MKHRKKWICLTMVLLTVLSLVGCGGATNPMDDDDHETLLESTAEEQTTAEGTTTEAVTEETTTEAPTTKAPTTTEPTTVKQTTTVKPTTTAQATTAESTTTEKPATTAKPTTTAAPQTQPPVEDNYDLLPGQTLEMTVYRTKSGKCYHYENPCGNGEYSPISLKEALDEGLDPCEKCVMH